MKRSPFCRIGSKRPILKPLLDAIPEHTIYVEPFFGSGALFFAKSPSPIEVISDMDADLMQSYVNILSIDASSRPPTPPTSLTAVRQFMATTPTQPWLKFYQSVYRWCGTFASKGTGRVYKTPDLTTRIHAVPFFQGRLANAHIHIDSYQSIIDQYDSPTTFFFLDPPYESSDKLYSHDTIDYEDMARRLSRVRGRFLLTMNDSRRVRHIFRQFHIRSIDVRGAGNQQSPIGGRRRRELIITNYAKK